MIAGAVARNYAEALFELASRSGEEETFGELLQEVVTLYRDEPAFRRFLDTPRIGLEEKKAALREVLGAHASEPFLRFLFLVLEKRRQRALPAIGETYTALADERAGRVHASIALAFAPDEPLRGEVVGALERALEKDVVPHFRENPRLLGGVVVRVGDRLLDGSLRRRLDDLRRELLTRADGAAET